jgi:protocatechuate 3,4-dioxygenase beta subunit
MDTVKFEHRRQFLFSLLTGALTLSTWRFKKLSLLNEALAAPQTCALAQEQILGPYYLEKDLIRKNITENKPGLPLRLKLRFLDASSCLPLRGAAIDIWQCDAGGLYSGFTKALPFAPPTDGSGHPLPYPSGNKPIGNVPPATPTDNLTFLRGIQLTDTDGEVEFETIYPGWYQGRTIHIHFKVRVADQPSGSFLDGHTCHTGQLFIDDQITSQVASLPLYKSNKTAYTPRDEDMVYEKEDGADFNLELKPLGADPLVSGFSGFAVVNVLPAKKSQM